MVYVGSTMIDHWLPGFRQHNDLALSEHNPVVSIWLGNRSRIAAHYDFPTNIACCGAGRRRVTLFPPDQLENLYVGPLDFTPAGQPISLVDFAEPDYERFPKFREALKSAVVVELEYSIYCMYHVDKCLVEFQHHQDLKSIKVPYYI